MSWLSTIKAPSHDLLTLTVQVTLVAVAGLLVAAVLRRNAARRHSVLLSAVLCILAGPLLMSVANWSGLAIRTLPASEAPAESVEVDDFSLMVPNHLQQQSSDARLAASAADQSSGFVFAGSTQEPAQDSLARIGTLTAVGPVASARMGQLIGSVWVLGTLVGLCGILRASWKTQAILRSVRPLDPAIHAVVISEATRQLGVSNFPRIGTTEKISVASVAGLFHRPWILIPSRYLEIASREELVQVLVHEAAHAIRRDPLIALLQQVSRALFWWHPLVHIVNRQLSRAREEVCDNFVLQHVEPDRYGETLLRMAALRPGTAATLLAVGLFDGRWTLEDRIQGILDHRRNTMTHVRFVTALSLLGGFASVSALVAGTRVVAQTPTDPPAASSISSADDPQDSAFEKRIADGGEGSAKTPQELDHVNASPMDEAGVYHISPVFKKLTKVAVIKREGPYGSDHTRLLQGWNHDKQTGNLTVKEMVDNEREMVIVYGKRNVPWAWKMQRPLLDVKVLIRKKAAVRGEDYEVDETTGTLQFLKKEDCKKGVHYYISFRYRDDSSKSSSISNHPDRALVRKFLGLPPTPDKKANIGQSIGTNASRTDNPMVWTTMQSLRSDSIDVGLGRRSVKEKLKWLERGEDFVYDEPLAMIALLREISLEEDSWMFVNGVPTERGQFLFHQELTKGEVKVILGDRLLEEGAGYKVDYERGIVTIVDKAIEKMNAKYHISAGSRSLGNHSNTALIRKLLQD